MREWNPRANEIFLRAAEIESPSERQAFLVIAQDDGRFIELCDASKPVMQAAFSPDASRVVSVSGDEHGGELKLWNAATGHELLTLRGFEITGQPAFSPDGNRLFAANSKPRHVLDLVRVWDATRSETPAAPDL